MLDTRIMEVQIAADDHRLLSANAEAWWLAQNDVFVPLESFLTEESRAEFLRRLDSGDPAWFLTCFSRAPEMPYLTRVVPKAPDGGEEATMIRVVLCPLNSLMDDYRDAIGALSAYDAMLSLQDDLYFVYDPEEDTIRLHNGRQSAYANGVQPLDSFCSALAARCDDENRNAPAELAAHLRGSSPRFRMSVSCNLFNDDIRIQAVQIRGVTSNLGNGRRVLTGMIHPMRTRGTEEQEVTYDALTGVISREHIIRTAEDRIDRLRAEHTAVAILDVDYFKHVNDNFGHQYGDQLLRQVAGIILSEIKDGGAVGRIGGDEFMMVFYQAESETALRAYLRSIKSVISAALPGVTVSIGAAIYPDAAPNYSDLFLVADYCLYLAKAKGRNRYIIHNPEKHPPLEKIREEQAAAGERNLVRGRDDLPLGDVLVQLQYMMRYGSRPSLATMINEFAVRAAVPLLTLWRTADRTMLTAGGKEKQDADALRDFFTVRAPEELEIPRYLKDGMTVTHTVAKKEEGFPELREDLLARQIMSYIYIPFTDAAGEKYALIFASVHRKVFWNEEHLKYYRLFTDLLAGCVLEEKPGEP